MSDRCTAACLTNIFFSIMSEIIEYTDLSDLEAKSEELYDTFSRVEYVGDVGLNRAKFFCC